MLADINNLHNSVNTLSKSNNELSENINKLELKNKGLKKKISNLTDSNSSAIKLYYDISETFGKYRMSNILTGVFFIIGTIVFYMLQYKYEKFIHFIDNFKLFYTTKKTINENINKKKTTNIKDTLDNLTKKKI